METTRRNFIKSAGLGAAGILVVPAVQASTKGSSSHDAHVVIVGGGFGGLSALRYFNIYNSRIKITLIELSKKFFTCPMSNTVIGGINDLSYITHEYDNVAARPNVNIIHDYVQRIDPAKKTISLAGSGNSISYDKCIVSPGIDFNFEATEGMSQHLAEGVFPHGWQAGRQTKILTERVKQMKNGDTMVIRVPPNPYRCPPAPYERASMVANHLIKTGKKRSKIILLDAKDKFAKQSGFEKLWPELFGNMIEWVPAINDGAVRSVNSGKGSFSTDMETYKGSVMNFIPNMKPARLAFDTDLVGDNGWCSVNRRNFESARYKDIYVIGDSADATKMPKSGVAANSQGKVAALSIACEIAGIDMPHPSYSNACYTSVGPLHALPVAHTYTYDAEKNLIVSAGKAHEHPSFKVSTKRSAEMSPQWYKAITGEMFS